MYPAVTTVRKEKINKRGKVFPLDTKVFVVVFDNKSHKKKTMCYIVFINKNTKMNSNLIFSNINENENYLFKSQYYQLG